MRREGGPSQGWSRSSWSRWSSPAEGLHTDQPGRASRTLTPTRKRRRSSSSRPPRPPPLPAPRCLSTGCRSTATALPPTPAGDDALGVANAWRRRVNERVAARVQTNVAETGQHPGPAVIERCQDDSDSVWNLQLALLSAGLTFFNGPTGCYGRHTRRACQEYQRKQGWTGSDADGIAGPQTIRRLGLVDWCGSTSRHPTTCETPTVTQQHIVAIATGPLVQTGRMKWLQSPTSVESRPRGDRCPTGTW